jgi:hypothetical protein
LVQLWLDPYYINDWRWLACPTIRFFIWKCGP